MTLQSPELCLHSLVWAKIEHYPWWPAKISKILQQNKSDIFKVSFFADPTYCFLERSNLRAFQGFDLSHQQEQPKDELLAKAIQLANNAFEKKKLSQKTSQVLQAKQQQSNNSNNVILDGVNLAQQKQQSIFDDSDSKSTDSRLEIQTSHQQNDMKENNGYAFLSKQLKVKALLAHYKLDCELILPNNSSGSISIVQEKTQEMEEQINIESESECDEKKYEEFKPRKAYHSKKGAMQKVKNKLIAINSCAAFKRKNIGKAAKKSQKSSHSTEVLVARKINSLLIQSGADSTTSHQIALQIIEKVNSIYKAEAQTSKAIQQKMNMLYVAVFQMIARSRGLCSEEIFFNVGELLRRQGGEIDKVEEEKSKMTQIQSIDLNEDRSLTVPEALF